MFIREKREREEMRQRERERERGNEKETEIERENERDERRKRSRDCIGIMSTLVHLTRIKWSMKLYSIQYFIFNFHLFLIHI